MHSNLKSIRKKKNWKICMKILKYAQKNNQKIITEKNVMQKIVFKMF